MLRAIDSAILCVRALARIAENWSFSCEDGTSIACAVSVIMEGTSLRTGGIELTVLKIPFRLLALKLLYE